MNFVHIGANDGRINDPIFPFVMRNRTATRILLIEPQPEIVPFRRENYSDHPDATIYGGAIGTGEALLLFRVKPELWNSYNPPYSWYEVGQAALPGNGNTTPPTS